MGDVRFAAPYHRIRYATNPVAEMRATSDEDVVAALAAAAASGDSYLSNVLATELMNRTRQARAVMDAIGEGVLVVDAAGTVTSANPEASRILRRGADALRGRPVEEGLPLRPPASAADVVRRVLDSVKPAGADAVLDAPALGVPVELAAFPVLRGEAPVAVVLVLRDVTARRAAEADRAGLLERERTARAEVENVLKALLESEERLRGVFESVPVGLYRSTPEGRMLDANPALVRIMGYPDVDTFLSVPVPILYVDPERRREWRDVVEREGTVRDFDVQVRRRDGRVIWVRNTARVARDEHGRTLWYDGVIEDVTERRAADEALRERDAALRRLADNVPDLIARFDRDLRHVYVNPAVEAASGLAAEDIVGRTNEELARPPGSADAWTRALRRAFETGEEATLEFEVPDPSGPRAFQARLVPELGPDGVATVLAVSRDLTHMKRVEAALRASEARIRTVIDQSPLSIQLFAPDGRHLQANAAWERLWHAPRSALEGYNILEDEQLERKGVLASLRRAFEGAVVRVPPVRYDPADGDHEGRARWVEAFAYPIRDDEGRIREVAVVLEDVTDRVDAENEVRRLNAVLEHRVRERTRELRDAVDDLEAFTYMVSHDLKEPVRALEVLTRLLDEDHARELTPDALDLARRARVAASRLSALLDGLLEASRGASPDAPAAGPVRVEDALAADAFTVRYRQLADERRARVEVRVAEGTPPVIASIPVLGQILGNIVLNAIRHNPRVEPLARVRAATWDVDPRFVEVVVEDDGPGFPASVLDAFNASGPRGVGLPSAHRSGGFGLIIARRALERVGGRLWLATSPEGGAAVHVALPTAGEPARRPGSETT